jgi:hypothetical protein
LDEERKSPADYTLFYCYQLAFLLIYNEILAAQQLWNRIPEQLKEQQHSPRSNSNTDDACSQSIYLRELWNISTYLSRGDTCQALIAIHNFAWSQELMVAMESLAAAIRCRRWDCVGRVYQTVGLPDLALSLNAPETEVVEG